MARKCRLTRPSLPVCVAFVIYRVSVNSCCFPLHITNWCMLNVFSDIMSRLEYFGLNGLLNCLCVSGWTLLMHWLSLVSKVMRNSIGGSSRRYNFYFGWNYILCERWHPLMLRFILILNIIYQCYTFMLSLLECPIRFSPILTRFRQTTILD